MKIKNMNPMAIHNASNERMTKYILKETLPVNLEDLDIPYLTYPGKDTLTRVSINRNFIIFHHMDEDMMNKRFFNKVSPYNRIYIGDWVCLSVSDPVVGRIIHTFYN